jgi:hypothetical protein
MLSKYCRCFAPPQLTVLDAAKEDARLDFLKVEEGCAELLSDQPHAMGSAAF